jgi:LysM repeat protein
MGTYIVQYGDTLSRIAERKLGRANRWPEIARLNHLQNPNLIFAGEILRLPDTLSGVLGTDSLHGGSTNLLNFNRDSAQIPANIALARGFLFVVFEQLPEVGVGKIIRKVAAIPRDFSLLPANPLAKLTPAEHALGAESQFLSASNRPFGAPTINGQPLILDVAKIKKAGGQIYSVSEVVRDLKRFVAENPSLRAPVDKLIWAVQEIEGEVLIEKGTPPNSASLPSAMHNAYIRSAEDLYAELRTGRITKIQLQEGLANLEKAYSRARILGQAGRVLMVIGVVVTIADLTKATNRSINQQSLKPLGAEIIRQAGGWGAAFGGAKIGFATGALFGIETGPGAIITGGIGAIVFGAAGYFGADWIADHISVN